MHTWSGYERSDASNLTDKTAWKRRSTMTSQPEINNRTKLLTAVGHVLVPLFFSAGEPTFWPVRIPGLMDGRTDGRNGLGLGSVVEHTGLFLAVVIQSTWLLFTRTRDECEGDFKVVGKFAWKSSLYTCISRWRTSKGIKFSATLTIRCSQNTFLTADSSRFHLVQR